MAAVHDLKRRLAMLRRQSGVAVPAGSASPLATPVADRLARMRVRPTGNERGSCPTDDDVAALLGGESIAPGLVLVERWVPDSEMHGQVSLQWTRPVQGGAPARGLLLDTETTGLAGGTGTLVFLLGMARQETGGLRLRQLFLTAFRGERVLLDIAAQWLRPGVQLITFNGKGFDAPLLSARYRLAGLADPVASLEHLDLLHAVRRAFGSRWSDCRLQTAEQRLIGFRREGDLPSAEVPEVWFALIRRGATGRLPSVLQHNRWDLLSLAALIPVLDGIYRGAANYEADVAAIAAGYVRDAKPELAYRLLMAQHQCLDAAGRRLLARLHRSRGEWEAAVALWEALAAAGDAEGLCSLAKYYEHIRRDFREALQLARRLTGLDPANREHVRRVARLEARCRHRQ